MSNELTISDYEEVLDSQKELIKKCGFLINGEDNHGSALTLLTDIEIHLQRLDFGIEALITMTRPSQLESPHSACQATLPNDHK